MSLPARFQHHQPLGTRAQQQPRLPPSQPVVYARSTRRRHPRRNKMIGSGWWLRWDAELFKNYTEA